MTRCFVAVSPPDEVLDAVGATSAGLALPDAGVRRTTRDQWHLTLQFLGSVDDVDAVAAALQGVDVAAGGVQLGGGGAFPRPARGTVLWLGVAEGEEWLQALAAAVGSVLEPLGFAPEAREFRPHVTLGRCKGTTDLRPAVDQVGRGAIGPAWEVAEVVLYESRLRGSGAEYVPRAVAPLA